jgi:hypothetical protein
MREMVLSLVFILSLVCPSSIPAGVFIDDFEDSAKTEAMWEVIHRDWVVQDGYYWAPGEAGLTEDPISLLDIEVEDGMVIEAQCGDKGDGNWSNFAVLYAYQEEDLVWSAGAGVGNDQWRMFQFTPIASKGGAWGIDFVPGVPVKTLLEPNEWYNIRVEVNGKDITLSGSSDPESNKLDEGNVCTLPDAPEGRIGLGAAGASPMFNEFKVTAQSLQVHTRNDKLATTWAKIKVMY